MKKMILLIAVIYHSNMNAIDQQRLRTINYIFGSSAAIEKTRFTFDTGGNVTRVAYFNGDGTVSRIHYYFYANGCVNKILDFSKSRLFSRSVLKKDERCHTLVHEEYDPAGKLIKKRENLYDNQGNLAGFKFLNGSNVAVGTGRISYDGKKMMKAIFEDNTTTQEMTYVYDDSNLLKEIRHTINEKNGRIYQNKMVLEFSLGPITEEASRYLFE